MSDACCSVALMFERLFYVDIHADEAGLRAQVEEFERLKSAAAAAQARATAAWASKRRATEEAAGVPAAKRGRGLAAEVALARHDAPSANTLARHTVGCAGAAIWGWRRRWSTRCPTHWRRCNRVISLNGGPP